MNLNVHLLNSTIPTSAASYNPGGYDLDRIRSGRMHQELRDSLTCGICLEIVRDPMECDNCRKHYCKWCIEKWKKNCPFQCPGQLRVRPSSHILQEFIYILKVKCQHCKELVLFPVIAEHEEWCRKDKCANKQCQAILEYRSRKEFRVEGSQSYFQVCDNICYQMFRLQSALGKSQQNSLSHSDNSDHLDYQNQASAFDEEAKQAHPQLQQSDQEAKKGQTKINKKRALQFINEFFKEQEEQDFQEQQRNQFKQLEVQGKPNTDMLFQQANSNMQQTLNSPLKQSQHLKMQREIVGVLTLKFHWDIPTEEPQPGVSQQQTLAQGAIRDIVSISRDKRALYLKEDDYYFRTFCGSIGLTEGIHYWEIVADARTEHELKVGVTKKQYVQNQDDQSNDQKTAFCDYEFGWAFFGVGQLRHNSNAVGTAYGKPFKRQGILGCFLNMNKGTLAFAIDGVYFGVAFEDENLKTGTGPIWPAVSLLHNAGCTLVSGKKPPYYFFE